MQRRTSRIALAAITSTALATGGLILASPAAQATDATTTTVTSFSGTPFVQYDDQSGSPGIEVKGTGNGDATGTFDLRCYNGPTGYTNLITNQAFAADGTFDVIFPSYRLEEETCVIRAIPRIGSTSQSPTDMSGFHGQSISGGEVDTFTDYSKSSTSLAGGQPYDYYIESSQTGGDMGWDSAGSCGLDYAYLYDSTGAPAGNPASGNTNTFSCAGYLPVDVAVGTAQNRTAIQVDGVNAVDPYNADYNLDGTRAPGLTVTVVHDGATGNQVITEPEPIVFCATTTYPLSSAGCATYTSAGIRLDRVITQGSAGRVASVRDTFTSTDGKAHDVSLAYESSMQNSANAGYRIPWSTSGSTYAAHTTGDAIGAAPAGPGSIDWVSDTTTDASFNNPVAGLTYSVAPSSILFGGSSYYYATYARHVAAGGSNGLTQTFSQGASQAEIDGYSTAAVTAYKSGLKVALTGVPTTTATKALTVHGAFSGGANGLPSTATVGVGTTQQNVPVANDGTFTAHVTLQPGPNSIAVVGTDDAGLQGTTSAAVTYANPVTASAPKVTKKMKTVTKKVKKGTKTVTVKVKKVASETVSDTLTCASFATAGCTGTVTITSGTGTVASKAFALAPGATATVVLTVSKRFLAKINALKHGKHLAAALTAVYADPAGGTLSTAPQAFRLA